MKKWTAVLLLTAMTAGLAACGSNKGADTNTDAPAQNESTEETVTTETSGAAQNADIQGTITLAAAASLEKTFTEHLIPMFEEQYPEVSIEGTYDSSGKLQSQIEAGADVDIFFSAALKHAADVAKGQKLLLHGLRFILIDLAAKRITLKFHRVSPKNL